MVLATSCLNLLPAGLQVCSAKHLLANVNYIWDTVLTRPLNVQSRHDGTWKGLRQKCGNGKKKKITEQIRLRCWRQLLLSLVSWRITEHEGSFTVWFIAPHIIKYIVSVRRTWELNMSGSLNVRLTWSQSAAECGACWTSSWWRCNCLLCRVLHESAFLLSTNQKSVFPNVLNHCQSNLFSRFPLLKSPNVLKMNFLMTTIWNHVVRLLKQGQNLRWLTTDVCVFVWNQKTKLGLILAEVALKWDSCVSASAHNTSSRRGAPHDHRARLRCADIASPILF